MTALLLAALLLAAPDDNVREPPPQPAQEKAPELTRAPSLLEFHPADYPPERLARGETADVACLVDLDAEGAVTGVLVEKGAAPDFDAAAAAAIQRFRFTPAELDGKPAPVRIRYVYHFVLERKAAPGADDTTGSLRGEVLEAGTRRPIPAAEVAVPDQGLLAIAGLDGKFELKGVAPGRVRVQVSAPGFAAADQAAQLAAKGTAELPRFYLRRTVLGEYSATVAGEKPKEAPTRRTLKHDELINVPGSLNDPIRVVQNLPGLNRAPFLGGALLVRGTPPGDTGIYLEGAKIPLLYHFVGGPSVINEQLLDRIDFYPGGFGAYYGRNLSGVIDIGTRKGDAQGVHGSLALDLLEAVGSVEGPIGKDTQVAVAARRSHIDLILPLFIRADPNRGTTLITPVYWDYQARIDHRLESGDALSLLAFGSDDKLSVINKGGRQQQPLSVDSHTGFHRLVLGWKRSISDGVQVSVSPQLGYGKQSFASDGAGQGSYARAQSASIADLSFGTRAEARWQPVPWFQLRPGLDVLFDRYDAAADLQSALDLRSLGVPITEELRISRLLPFAQFGEYLEGELKAGIFTITPGLRFDQVHWSGHTRGTFDPRLWTRAQLDETLSLKSYVGLYHQPPDPLNIEADLGNPALVDRWAVQTGFGAEKRFSDVWSVSLEGFYNQRGSLVTGVDARVLPDGTVDNPKLGNRGIGRAFGLELLVRREITSKLYGWIAYTLSRSEVLSNPGDQWQRFRFDQPHIFTAVVGFRPSVGWELSGRYRFVSGNPMAPVLSATFDADTGSFLADRGTFGADRLPFFSQLDLRGQYTWSGDLIAVSAYLDVQNVTNHRNEELHVYDYRYREQGSIPGLPILPTLGAKVRF